MAGPLTPACAIPASKPSYGEVCRAFSRADGFRALGWSPGPEVDLGRTILDRHAGTGRRALTWFARDGSRSDYTFDELADWSARFASALRPLGVERGDRVSGYLPRVPETLIAMIGAWKAGAIYVPIFTGFGSDAIAYRVRNSGARILCTHREYRGRVPALPDDVHVVTVARNRPGPATRSSGLGTAPFIDREEARHPSSARPGDGLHGRGAHRPAVGVAIDRDAAGDHRAGTTPASAARANRDTDFWTAVEGETGRMATTSVRRDDPAVLLYTSGSTGPPKGVQIAANFPLAIHPYVVYGVDLRPDDVFWPTGDPGWGYGLVCYMLALAMGVAVTFQEAAPAAEACLARLSDHGVTNLATTPTLLRSIMALGSDVVRRYPVRLRAVSSCGEPLNAEVVAFFREHWGVTVMDHYGSSEFGLPIGNLNAVEMPVKPGSMGLPMPGSVMAVVDDDGREVAAGTVGHVAMRPDPEGYYSLGYWRDPERTQALDRGGWMTIGDLARSDADGYFWFEGRADDVIKSAGYRIGPFEVESAILTHPAVAEAAVVGVPDALRGQIVKAYVVLRPGVTGYPGLEGEIVDVVKTHVGHHQQPRAIEFLAELPKTETGKIQRFLLR